MMKFNDELNLDHRIAQMLLQIKAIKLSPGNPFTWASGIRSPIYCDNRVVLSHTGVRNAVIQAYVEKTRTFENIDFIAGVATAGIAFGALLSHELDLPFVYVRSKAKEHGRQNLIEGDLRQNSRVLVVEDLISTGKSSLQAVEAIREAGSHVLGVLAIFSYGFDQAYAHFQEAGCPFQTITSYPILIEEAVKEKYILEKDQIILTEWSKDPSEWYENNFSGI